MDALEQLSQYRDIEPVDDRVVAATVRTVVAAVHDNSDIAAGPSHRSGGLRRHSRRIAIAAGATLAAMAAGGGIAAATGLFHSPPQPLPPALSFMNSPDPSNSLGATIRLTVPGPDGTTLQVVTDTFTVGGNVDSCVALGIREPNGQADSGPSGECSATSAPPGIPLPALRQMTPSVDLQTWQAPSGASYYVIFGQGSPGVAEVTLANSRGVAAAKEPANPGGYVIYIPAANFTSYSHLIFTDKSGKVLFSQDVNA